jgi:bifunctional UDP-N-acetylglucosamine pyrophosphorylase/glucosamine-1-phosphate N-acetyltransferase
MPLIDTSSLKEFLNHKEKIVLSTFKLENPTGYGRVIISDNEVEYIDANQEELNTKIVNAGVYMFDRDILVKYVGKLSNDNKQKEYYITDLIASSIKDKISVKPILVDKDKFIGVNSIDDLKEAERIFNLN